MGKVGTDVLVLAVAGQQIALLASAVERVIPAAFPTPLPGAPGIVEGLLDVGGDVVPVLSLRHRLGLPARPVELSDCLVLADAGGRRVAVAADAALEFTTVLAAELRPDRLLDSAACVTATGVRGGELLVVLDLSRFLSRQETADLRNAVARQGEPQRG